MGPRLVVVIDDKGVNADRLMTAAIKRGDERTRKFYKNARKVWLFANNAILDEQQIKDQRIRFGREYEEARHVRSNEECRDVLEEVCRDTLRRDQGVLVHLDIQLDEDICVDTPDCKSSAVAKRLREWIASGYKILVHVHSTDKAATEVAKSLDREKVRATHTGAIGSADEGADSFEELRGIVLDVMERWRRAYPGNVINILWPVETETWFFSDDSAVPHNWPLDGRGLDQIQVYLREIMGLSVSEEWLSINGKCVHSALKHMVGYSSVAQGEAQGGGGRNCNLGSAALLLLSASARSGCLGVEELLEWDLKRHVELPEILSAGQREEEAQLAMAALYNLFKSLALIKGSSGKCALVAASLDRGALRAHYSLGEANVKKAIDTFERVLQGTSSGKEGDFGRAAGEFLLRARCAGGCLDQRCVLNMYPRARVVGEVVLELRPCQEM